MIIGKTGAPQNPVLDSIESVIKQGGTPEAEQCAMYLRIIKAATNKAAEAVAETASFIKDGLDDLVKTI